jgi:hypothetical protein
MASPSGLGKKDALSKKEEFFRNLNLLATKRVKVKYCRTIKERLRQLHSLYRHAVNSAFALNSHLNMAYMLQLYLMFLSPFSHFLFQVMH